MTWRDVLLTVIFAGLVIGILGLLALWQPIFDLLERWADKRSREQ